jgi:ribosomal protein S18 acetylase RimI-like enzyme
MSDPLCQIVEWDSRFFGLKIGRLNPARPSLLDVEESLRWAREHSARCLYALIDSDDPGCVRALEEQAFVRVDERVTLAAHTANRQDVRIPAGGELGVWNEEDIAALRTIASRNHTDSKYYADGHFPAAKCDELYAIWIENSCHGFANHVLVARQSGAPVGYITCHLRGSGRGQIGLLGVGEAGRGKGWGQALVRSSLNWFAGQGASDVIVVTQGRNAAAQALYQKCGFEICSEQWWFHKWFDRPGE